MAGLDGLVDRETILAIEPLPHTMLDVTDCEEAYLAIADMIGMRMPFTFGHSRAVAALAEAAGGASGFPPQTFASCGGRRLNTCRVDSAVFVCRNHFTPKLTKFVVQLLKLKVNRVG